MITAVLSGDLFLYFHLCVYVYVCHVFMCVVCMYHVCMCSMCVCHVYTDTCREQKRESDPQQLESHVVVSHCHWGSKPGPLGEQEVPLLSL